MPGYCTVRAEARLVEYLAVSFRRSNPPRAVFAATQSISPGKILVLVIGVELVLEGKGCWNSGDMLSLRWLIGDDLIPAIKYNGRKQDIFVYKKTSAPSRHK